MGTAHVLEAVRKAPSVRAVVSVTTDKCYRNQEWVWPYRETDPLGGYDPYASSKACAEIVSAAYRSSFFPVDRLQEHHVALEM
jgi:CDP-glucose 4,6-dehydratase